MDPKIFGATLMFIIGGIVMFVLPKRQNASKKIMLYRMGSVILGWIIGVGYFWLTYKSPQ